MSTMLSPEGLAGHPVLRRIEDCPSCESDRRPRMFVCDYHEGWWDGYDVAKEATP